MEDLFEVVSCYFPIDFTQPADDKIGIFFVSIYLSIYLSICMYVCMCVSILSMCIDRSIYLSVRACAFFFMHIPFYGVALVPDKHCGTLQGGRAGDHKILMLKITKK